MRFVDGSNVLFASDWITVRRVPFGGDVATKDELALVKTVEDSSSSTSCAAMACWARRRTSPPTSAIAKSCVPLAKAIAAGQTLEQAQASVTMDAYKDWEFYEQQRPANIAGTYRALNAGR